MDEPPTTDHILLYQGVIMKNQVIYALIVLQVITTGFWFSEVKSANASEVSCQMKLIVQTRAINRLLNDLDYEYQTIKKMEKKTKFRPKIMVTK